MGIDVPCKNGTPYSLIRISEYSHRMNGNVSNPNIQHRGLSTSFRKLQLPGVSSPNSVDIMYKYLYLRAYPFTRVSIYKVLVTLYTLTDPLPCPTGNAATEFTL